MLGIISPQAVGDGLGRHERVAVREGVPGAQVTFGVCVWIFFWFRSIEPESADANGEVCRLGKVVEGRARLWVPSVVVGRIVEQPSALLHLLIEARVAAKPAPDGHHEVDVLCLQRRHHPGWVWVLRAVPLGAPPERTPIEPILHDRIERYPALAEPAGRLENLVLRLVVLLALPEPICPPRIERRLSGQDAVPRDGVVRRGGEDEVVVDEVPKE
mmetsp:Transcript_93217/g.268379  ORF Transcript_93217/g.268379 Transcript_93217/m.268379 type:complete len:215 (-) Transcript_93217:915-1559(-)